MGSWCVVCALSGVPIRPGDPVIGWKVQLSPFGALGSDPMFVPTSLPVIGKYDDYGGIEAEDADFNFDVSSALEGDGMNVICHLEMWKQAVKQFDHKDFAGKECPSLKDSWEKVQRIYADDKLFYNKISASKPDDIHWQRRCDPMNMAHGALSRCEQGVNFIWYLNKFTLGVNGKVSTKGLKYDEIDLIPYADRAGEFETILLNGVINGFSDYQLELLENLCKVYATAIFRCRPILPDQCNRCVQYPDYKKENAWIKAVYQFAVVDKRKPKGKKKKKA